MKTFKLSISTPTGHKFEMEEIQMLTADLLEGRIGILADHTPMVSSLKVSTFRIKDKDGGEIQGAIKGGIFDVKKDEVIILTPNFCMEDEVNKQHCEDEIKDVEHQMQSDVKESEAKSLDERIKYAKLKLSLM